MEDIYYDFEGFQFHKVRLKAVQNDEQALEYVVSIP